MIIANYSASTLDELIKVLTEIREVYADSRSPLYVKTPGWDELRVSVEQQKLTDNSETFDVVIAARTHAAAPAV